MRNDYLGFHFCSVNDFLTQQGELRHWITHTHRGTHAHKQLHHMWRVGGMYWITQKNHISITCGMWQHVEKNKGELSLTVL